MSGQGGPAMIREPLKVYGAMRGWVAIYLRGVVVFSVGTVPAAAAVVPADGNNPA